MAKWGEGDPRWIVEERPDAVNVNNWHWTERNACGWSKTKFDQLFNGYVIENNLFECKITGVEKSTGEAVANNRKGKLIFFYEWELTLEWEGKLAAEKDKIKGKIVIPNLSEENEVHEVDVDISTNESSSQGDVLRSVMKELTTNKVREQLGKYIQGLKAEFSQGMILPSKGNNEDTVNKNNLCHTASGTETKVQVNSNAVNAAKSTSDVKTPSHKINTTSIEINDTFKCSAQELYEAFTKPDMAAAFTMGSVTLDPKPGGKFDLFNGNITGEFIELVPYSRIVQTWRWKSWPSDHYSVVTMDIKQQKNETEFKLEQRGIPEEDSRYIRENWMTYYLGAIKRTFGFGFYF